MAFRFKQTHQMLAHEEPARKVEVLLISPPLYRLSGNAQSSPPLGLLTVAAFLNKNRIVARAYNADYEKKISSGKIGEGDYKKNLHDPGFEAWQEVRRTIRKYKPRIVGMSVVTTNYVSALKVARIAKEEGAIVVFGGAHPTALPEETAKNADVDAAVVGEGEQTILEIAQGKPFEEIDGLCFQKDGKIIRTNPRAVLPDLDTLPFPILEDLVWEHDQKYSFNEMGVSRGCPYLCTFCASGALWNRKVRMRSPFSIYLEMLFRMQRYGTTNFQFWDETMTLDKKRIFDFCDLIKDLGITWSCQTRVDLVTEELLTKMKASGCNAIAMGVESGNQRVLDINRKAYKTEQAKEAARLIRKVGGISFTTFVIVGLPGETEESIQDTANLMKEIDPDAIVPNLATPLPGTEMFELADKSGWIKHKNWEDYHIIGTAHSVMEIPTLSQEKVQQGYLYLQEIADRKRSRKLRAAYLKPSFIYHQVLHSSPKDLLANAKLFFSIVKGSP